MIMSIKTLMVHKDMKLKTSMVYKDKDMKLAFVQVFGNYIYNNQKVEEEIKVMYK